MPARHATGTRRRARRRSRGTRHARASSSSSSWLSSSLRPSSAALWAAPWGTRTTTTRRRRPSARGVVEPGARGARLRRRHRRRRPRVEVADLRRLRAALLPQPAQILVVVEEEEAWEASAVSPTRRQRTLRHTRSPLLLLSPTLLVQGQPDPAFATWVVLGYPACCTRPCTRYPFVYFILDGIRSIVHFFVLMLGYIATIFLSSPSEPHVAAFARLPCNVVMMDSHAHSQSSLASC